MFIRNPIIQFGAVPVSGAAVKSCFPKLSSPEKKIQALERSGELIRLKRNLFLVNPELTGRAAALELCANHIYGPSYISLQWALSYYGMIPEQVFLITSVTTKRSREFDTPIGRFSYMQVPSAYFPIGVESVTRDKIGYLMASREKALCDTILYDNYVPAQSLKSLAIYLEEDMRLDMDILPELNPAIIEQCAQVGKKSHILNNLLRLISR